HIVHAPDGTVFMVAGEVLGGKMQGHIGRIGPVEQAGRETMVLCHRQPVPNGIAGSRIAVGVLSEVSQNVWLQFVVAAAEAGQASAQVVLFAPTATVYIGGAESLDVLVPTVVEQGRLYLCPTVYNDVFSGFHVIVLLSYNSRR